MSITVPTHIDNPFTKSTIKVLVSGSGTGATRLTIDDLKKHLVYTDPQAGKIVLTVLSQVDATLREQIIDWVIRSQPHYTKAELEALLENLDKNREFRDARTQNNIPLAA